MKQCDEEKAQASPDLRAEDQKSSRGHGKALQASKYSQNYHLLYF